MGAPRHRVQNPANPCKPSGAREALKTQGKGCRPTSATSTAVSQVDGVRKGRNPEGQPAEGNAAQTAGPGGRARHKVENQATHQRHRKPNIQSPTARAGQATGARNVAEPAKGNLRQDMLRKTAGTTKRGTEATPARGSTTAYPAPSSRRERRHSSAAPERTYTHTQGQPVRRAAAKNPQGQHRRRRSKCRRGIRS